MGKSLPPPPFFEIVLDGSERGALCLSLFLYLITCFSVYGVKYRYFVN